MPDLTYADAVRTVEKHYRSSFGPSGTFYVSPDGFRDVLDFYVPWGAREYLVGGDPAFLLMNGLSTFVDRRTGDLREEFTPDVLDKLAAMEPVTA